MSILMITVTKMYNSVHLPELPCIFYLLTGLYCPFCGGTRSMKALFHGQFLLAVHENPLSPLLVLTAILLILELCLKKSGRTIRLFPRNAGFRTVVLTLWLLWAVLRNVFPALQPLT